MTRTLLFLLFFVLLAAEPLGVNLSLAPGLSVKNAFLYMILAGIAVDTALKRNRQPELLSVFIPFSLYLFYAVMTLITIVLIIDYPRYDPLYSIISFKSGAADHLLVFMVFFYGVLTAKDSMALIKVMIWTVIVANLITVIDGFNIPDLGLVDERDDGRIGGPIGESNQYAAFLVLFLPATIALALIERGALRALAVLGVMASLLALLMTASRGGFVGLAIGSVISAFFLRQYVSTRGVAVAVSSIVLVAVVGLAVMYVGGFGDLLYDRFIGESTSGGASRISSGRTYIWTTALEKMLTEPVSLITGFGWDTYFQFRVFRFAPHNSYLKVFFELGLIGLLLLLTALVNILRVARKGLRKAQSDEAKMLVAFGFGLIGILVAIFFVDITTPWIQIWAYVGTAMRLALANSESFRGVDLIDRKSLAEDRLIGTA